MSGRVRLSSVGRWEKRECSLCKQLQLPQRLPDQKREYVEREQLEQVYDIYADLRIVCVSSLLIQEIKRIIKESEIMK